MKWLFVLSVLGVMACASEPSRTTPENSDTDVSVPDVADNNTIEPDAGEDLGEPENNTDEPVPYVFPGELTTSGVRFSGHIGASQRATIKLTAEASDTIAIWFRNTGDAAWAPGLNLYRPGSQTPIAYSHATPPGDASIPYNAAEISEGYTLFQANVYDLVVENRTAVAGQFEFELSCLEGPCRLLARDFDEDGIPDDEDNCPYVKNADQADSNQNGVGNLCDGVDPYPNLQDNTLESAMRAEYSATHRVLDYRDARQLMFGSVDNKEGVVECVYTGFLVETRGIPDYLVMNAEHTWPQSRGGDGIAKSDLHHLMPATAESNTQRSNLFYGAVTEVLWTEGGSKRGRDAAGESRFEPRPVHKGNAARALFYVAVMYQLDIPAHEETLLRQWHEVDPPDAVEQARNRAIATLQGSRNPFIEFPELVSRIRDF